MKQESQGSRWYVVHTYSGHENKVKVNIEKLVENRGMQDTIFEVRVPVEEVPEVKNGKKRIKERKMFPSYVIIKMIMTDESWYLVRNTRGVTGFVGPGSKPVPLTDEEVKALGVIDRLPPIELEVGDTIKVKEGPFEDFIGTVESISQEKRKVKAFVSMFGRETIIELDYDQIEKV
ncbi:MAG TPA: transcription termination/antitermination protein NusG [Sedimentibacter sp.]|jgi:transcriptional antiterminator NusG|nr:transcription termination/antitermination protein NusG [Tissierellia bacterium]HAS92339.1 transcription termination/antitermination protein NusG [Clostridiales bacterium]HOT21383.1 transcription termination/antitermination protein NusG [Sedimentibacter sp.]HPB79987.1 transcription termination/antitermination protein NusG [Sedimentibacter sp.]HQK53373.1 transcription termination/antitermination protein NusG [Sedimentibacter sp.]